MKRSCGKKSPWKDLNIDESLTRKREFEKYLATCADCIHARLRAHATNVGAGAVGAQPGKQLVADVALDTHGARVDAKDVRAALKVGQPELHLAVQPPRTQEGGVECVRTVVSGGAR